MFTGLIREFGEVVSYENNFLTIRAKHSPKIGDSIAVNGACLTVVSTHNDTFVVELSKESRGILALENYKNFVHIEPAMRLSDRLEGHIVQGHVDAVGTIIAIKKTENAHDFFVRCDDEIKKYIVPKGSIAIDGVSLTINELTENGFRLTIIAHTVAQTLFGSYGVGDLVNIESDMFARYIHHMLGQKDNKTKWAEIDKILASY